MNRCRACNAPRPNEDFTTVSGPSGTFYVCRPHPDRSGLCFREGVMGREVHSLVPQADKQGDKWNGPVRPFTPDWDRLLREARA